jgi:hypothetical protein
MPRALEIFPRDILCTPITRSSVLFCIFLTEVFLKLSEVFLTLTEVFPCFFLSCKANARVKLAKTGHGPHSTTLVCICVVRMLLFVLFCCYLCCSMYCLCVNVYCHRVTTQLQLINIPYIISFAHLTRIVHLIDLDLVTCNNIWQTVQHLVRGSRLRPLLFFISGTRKHKVP